jgi:ATP-binding cassette subfamily F protein uup
VQPALLRSRSPEVRTGGATSVAQRSSPKKKLSYNDQREFEQLPVRIGELEAEQESLNQATVHPEFYKEPAAAIEQVLARLDRVHGELLELYKAWDDLDSRSK